MSDNIENLQKQLTAEKARSKELAGIARFYRSTIFLTSKEWHYEISLKINKADKALAGLEKLEGGE